ncbi:MAG: leucine-rich repeat domain-containing protein [Phycisphaerales bacterium]|nr:leucine-rich repeat domain-containing protein [Phycisphaerales bacterium]
MFQKTGKTRPTHNSRHILESLDNRTMLSASPLLPKLAVPDNHATSVALIAPQDQAAVVPAATAADVAADPAPDGYNADDWAKYSTAVDNNGLTADMVTWTQINSEMRLTQVIASDAGLNGTLDLSGCTELSSLDCSFNSLASLNLSDCTALQTLDCSTNQLTSLDLSDCTALQSLNCSTNQLTSLNLSGFTALQTLDCSNNQLTFSTLPLTSNTYSPQSDISIVSSLARDAMLDLSTESMIGGVPTTYTWYYADGTTVSPDNYTETNGQFVFDGLHTDDVIYCTMTNATFPELTLQTTEVTILASTLAAPTGVTATAKDAVTLTVSWDAVPGASGYVIQVGTKTKTVTDGTTLTFDFDDLKVGTTYDVCVMAIGTGDYSDSPYSDTVSATTGVAPYNAYDWAKYTTAIAKNGLTEDMVIWTVVNDELKIKSIDATNSSSSGPFTRPLSGSLNLAGCTALISLNCDNNNQLTSLNVSGCTALQELDCGNNSQFTSLNVSGCTALQELDCSNDQLKSLNVSRCTALQSLACYNNPLKSLNVSRCTALESLDCSYNLLKSLNVSNCTALTALNCSHNSYLKSLNVSGRTALQILSCSYNSRLKSLNASGCTALQQLVCNNNRLTSLNISKCTALQILTCSSNRLKSLNASTCTALLLLSCNSNQLKSLNISRGTALQNLNCSNNKLSSLNLSACAALQILTCSNNKLSSLNASACTALQNLTCSGNKLKSLNVSASTTLQTLTCSGNRLTSLNVSGYTALQNLNCSNNKLKSLNVSACTALQTLNCSNNQLKSLNVSACTALQTLNCSGNKWLTSLDLSGCTALSNNNITCDAPTKAKGIKSSSTLSTVTLTWKTIANNAQYEIICIALGVDEYVTGNTVTIPGLYPGMSYTFFVVATGFNGMQAAAVNVNAKTQTYTAVTNVKATSSANSVTLTWAASKFPETTSYQVFRLDGNTETEVWSGNYTELPVTIPGLTPSTKYTFIVRAISSTLGGIQSADAKISTSTTR